VIPLRSTLRVNSKTPVLVALIAIQVLIFVYEFRLDPENFRALLFQWGMVPDFLTRSIAGSWYTAITYMFLHGSWLHLIGNILFLWVFGRNLEDLLGSARFLLFYLLCGILGAAGHYASNPYSPMPTVGASGAIFGVLGGFLMKFPRARIVTIVPIFLFLTTAEIPAWLMLLYWMALQLVSGFGSLGSANYMANNSAWFAHIAGFLAGMLLIRYFPTRHAGALPAAG
jgi:membrane associated rhomboid family serine protease